MHIITILRTYLGLSQVELAAAAGITQADLSEMENHMLYGHMTKFIRVANHLKIPLEALVKNDPTKIPESFFGYHHKPNYLEISEHAPLKQSREGEEFIYQRECDRVAQTYPQLVDLVLPRYKMKRACLGYDILSYNENGTPICLEVKTNATQTNSFYLTQREINTAEKMTAEGTPYYITLITGWNTAHREIRDFLFADLERNFESSAQQYLYTPKQEPMREWITGLEYHRRKLGLTQAELAQATGVSATEWCLCETGERLASVQAHLRISELLGVTIDQLLTKYRLSEVIDGVREL